MKELLSLIQQIIASADVDFKDKPTLLTAMVAESLAAKLPLPTSPVEDKKALFVTQYKTGVLMNLGKVNELTVIDIDRAAELVYKIWGIRYSLVHEMTEPRSGRLLAMAVAENNFNIAPDFVKVLQAYPKAYLSPYSLDALDVE